MTTTTDTNRFSVNYPALLRKLGDGRPFGLLSQQSSPPGDAIRGGKSPSIRCTVTLRNHVDLY